MNKILITALFLGFLFQINCRTQTSLQTSSQHQKKIALVIGNSNYLKGNMLVNPVNDARLMQNALRTIGFTVMEYENLNHVQLNKAVTDFGNSLKSNDIGLVYYAGKTAQLNGLSLMIPVDADLKSETPVENECVNVSQLLELMEGSKLKVKDIDY